MLTQSLTFFAQVSVVIDFSDSLNWIFTGRYVSLWCKLFLEIIFVHHLIFPASNVLVDHL
jgi:hypothetical protein